jgi:hypothetical protein
MATKETNVVRAQDEAAYTLCAQTEPRKFEESIWSYLMYFVDSVGTIVVSSPGTDGILVV